MDRFEGIEREKSLRHDGKLTWDIFHVWPDGFQRDGVRFTSTVHVYIAEPPKSAKEARVRLWIPGPGGQQGDPEHTIGFGEELWAPVAGWGIASVVSMDDVPLHFYWELSAGKGDTPAPRGMVQAPQIRVPVSPPPGV